MNGRLESFFAHEDLEVYRESIAFIAWLSPLLEETTRAGEVKDQLDRASTSIPLNIAEDNGKFGPKEWDENSFPDLASRVRRGSPDPAARHLTEGLRPHVRLGDLRSARWQGQETLPQRAHRRWESREVISVPFLKIAAGSLITLMDPRSNVPLDWIFWWPRRKSRRTRFFREKRAFRRSSGCSWA
jgi:23S rRNA-intervening sequence protein